MSANLFGERFMGNKVPAWHQLGQVFDKPMTATEAGDECDLFYTVNKLPLVAQEATPFGVSITETGLFGLVREPTQDDPQQRFFGSCSANYEIIQNKELAQLMDILTDEWPVETCAALGNGETTFFLLKAPLVTVAGDEVQQYFAIVDTKDGKTALQIVFTPVRMVCQNTLITGLRQATASIKLAHIDTIDQVTWRLQLLEKMRGSMGATLDVFEKMAKYTLGASAIEAALKVAYPDPSKPGKVEMMQELGTEAETILGEHYERFQSITDSWNYYTNVAAVRRAETMVRLDKFNQEFSDKANTAWAVWNSVVENEDFRTGPASMFESTLFGARARTKKRAMAYLAAQIEKPKKGRPAKK